MFRFSIRALLILTILVALPLMIYLPRPLTLKSLPNAQPSTEVQSLVKRYKLSDFQYISDDFLNHEDYFQEYSYVLVSQQTNGTIVRELVVGQNGNEIEQAQGPPPFEHLAGRAKLHDSIPTLEELNKFSTIDEFESLFGWQKMYDTYGNLSEGWYSCLSYSGFVIVNNQIRVTWVHLNVSRDPSFDEESSFIIAEEHGGWEIHRRDLIQMTYEINGNFAVSKSKYQ